jgi:hypothetical protein
MEACVRCGYVCDLSGSVIDVDGCLLPVGHEGPHEFVDENSEKRYRWEFDVEIGQDVYWRVEE